MARRRRTRRGPRILGLSRLIRTRTRSPRRRRRRKGTRRRRNPRVVLIGAPRRRRRKGGPRRRRTRRRYSPRRRRAALLLVPRRRRAAGRMRRALGLRFRTGTLGTWFSYAVGFAAGWVTTSYLYEKLLESRLGHSLVMRAVGRALSGIVTSWLFNQVTSARQLRTSFYAGAAGYWVIWTVGDIGKAYGVTLPGVMLPAAAPVAPPAPAIPPGDKTPAAPIPPPSPAKAPAVMQSLAWPPLPDRYRPLW
jgi:hypothetical protein